MSRPLQKRSSRHSSPDSHDVSVLYGANQPEYDLIAARGDDMLKLSVKGSQDGGWGLTQSYLSKEIRADYHGAADRWLARHTFQTAICLVQFADVPDDELPRMYLAWPAEVAAQLRNASRGEAIRSCGKIICTDLALSPPERGTDYRMIGG